MRPYTFTAKPKRGKPVKITVRAIENGHGRIDHYLYESPQQNLRTQSQRSKDVLAAIKRDAFEQHGHMPDVITSSVVITRLKTQTHTQQARKLRDKTAKLVAESDEYAEALATAKQDLHKHDDVRSLINWCFRLKDSLDRYEYEVKQRFDSTVAALIEEMALGPQLPWVMHVTESYRRNAGIPAIQGLFGDDRSYVPNNELVTPTTEDLAAAIEAWKELAGES